LILRFLTTFFLLLLRHHHHHHHHHKLDGFDHTQAEFGFPNSQGSIAEYVYFIDDQLCSPIDGNKTLGYPKHHQGLNPPFILLVDDGECSAVTKARHAQMAGASALLIAHGRCLCSNQKCIDGQEEHDKADCIPKSPGVTNDGSGSDISIPTFMIFKDLAHPLKVHLRDNDKPALAELMWGLRPVLDDQPECLPLSMHMWTTPYDLGVSLQEYQNFYNVAKHLEGKVYFRPTYTLIDGTRFDCPSHQGQQDSPCDHLCSNGGRYCTTHSKDLSGYSVVMETLRRLCIWHRLEDKGNSTKDTAPWWNYVLYFKEHCMDSPYHFADGNCVHAAYQHAKLDEAVISQCMTDTGHPSNDEPNTLLEEMLQHTKQSGVVSLPSITVNHQPLEHFSSTELFRVLCEEYYYDPNVKVPEICKQCAACLNAMDCLEKGGKCPNTWSDDNFTPSDKTKKDKNKKAKSRRHRKIFWSLSAVVIVGAAVYRFKKLQNDNLGDRPSMEDYFALSNTD
jgi:hypothetical protein